MKRTCWNLRASAEKWSQFAHELDERQPATKVILSCKDIPLNERYKMWYKEIEKAAWCTLGKTTIKQGAEQKISENVTILCKKKRTMKTLIKKEHQPEKRHKLISEYKVIQQEVHEAIIKEHPK